MYPKSRRNDSARFVGPFTSISSSTTMQMLSGLKRAESVVSSVTTVSRATGVSVRSGPSADCKTKIIQE